MKEKLGRIISLLFILLLMGCATQKKITLQGFYQSELIDQYIIQLSFDKNDQSFIEYINNIDVNKGTYELWDDNTYLLKGDNQTITIKLDETDSFEMVFSKLNDGNSIKLIKNGPLPTIFDSEFSEEIKIEMKNLLDE
ncbi:MAG: hypothetical protein ACRCS6_01375 [Turicibacter sp.]